MAPCFVVSRTIVLLSVGVTIVQSRSGSADSCSTSTTSCSGSTISSPGSHKPHSQTCCTSHNKTPHRHHINYNPVTKPMDPFYTSQTPRGCVYTSQASTAYQGCGPVVGPHASIPQQAISPCPQFCEYQTPTVHTHYYQMPPQPAFGYSAPIVAQHRPLIPIIHQVQQVQVPQTSLSKIPSHDCSKCAESSKGLSVYRRGSSRRPVEYKYYDSLLESPLLFASKANSSSKKRNEGMMMTKKTKKTVTVDKAGFVHKKSIVEVEENRPPKDELTLNSYTRSTAYGKLMRNPKHSCC